VFDRGADPQVLALCNGYRAHVWSPQSTTLDEYCFRLAELDVVVTSRAHGAICAAVLGVPSLILDIEPKLRTIHDLLPRATRLVPSSAELLKTWLPRLAELLSVSPVDNKAQVNSAMAESLKLISRDTPTS
jgi:polysaccharide pyruvyl transferase WcaK-like protein